jgi:hypothetical protein
MDEREQFQEVENGEPFDAQPPRERAGMAQQGRPGAQTPSRLAQIDALDLAVGTEPDRMPRPGDERRRIGHQQTPCWRRRRTDIVHGRRV